MLDEAVLDEAIAGCDWVFHLQANADVRHGLEHPRRDLEQNTIATSNVLEAMRAHGVTRIAFSSTGSVYGEPEVFPDARGRAVPDPDLALRSVQARRRGSDQRLRRRLRLHRADLPLRLDSRRALHARPRVRLLSRAASATRRGCGCSATAARRSPTSTSRTACRRSCWPPSATPTSRGAHVYNLGTEETIVVDDSVGLITAASRLLAGDRPHRRPARLDRRQSADPPRLHAASRASAGRPS